MKNKDGLIGKYLCNKANVVNYFYIKSVSNLKHFDKHYHVYYLKSTI